MDRLLKGSMNHEQDSTNNHEIYKISHKYMSGNVIAQDKRATHKITKTKAVPTRRGIFQGVMLSALLFCLALIPLFYMINRTGYGYKCYGKIISHLLYTDDLKLYAANDKLLETLLPRIHGFTKEMNAKFSLGSCVKSTLGRGKLVKSINIILDKANAIRELDQRQTD